MFSMVMMLHDVTFLFHHSKSQRKTCAATGVRLDRGGRIIKVTPRSVGWLLAYHGVNLHVGDCIGESVYKDAYNHKVHSHDCSDKNGLEWHMCKSVVCSCYCYDIVAFATGHRWVQ